MSSPFLGEIKIFGFNFPPRGYAFCNGQLIAIQQNTALFSLLGTFYGGNGVTTFALPNLQGQWAMGYGDGPGLTPRVIGEVGGQATVTLTETEIPAHTHNVTGVKGSLVPNRSTSPQGRYWANEPKAVPQPQKPPYMNTQPDTNLAPGAISDVGGSQPHENRPPFLVLNYCIATQGIFPARN